MPFTTRQIAMVLAVSHTSSAVPRPDTLGVVTQARDANLGTGPVSAGATLYDGDRLSTLGNGALTLRSGTSMLYLSSESRVTLRALPSSQGHPGRPKRRHTGVLRLADCSHGYHRG